MIKLMDILEDIVAEQEQYKMFHGGDELEIPGKIKSMTGKRGRHGETDVDWDAHGLNYQKYREKNPLPPIDPEIIKQWKKNMHQEKPHGKTYIT